MKDYILYIFIFMCFIACTNKKQESHQNKYYFEKQKTVLENNNDYFYSFTTYYDNSKKEIYRLKLRTLQNGISVNNLNNKIKNEIVISGEQEEHLKRLRGFIYKNDDSIFLLGTTKLLIINSESATMYEEFFNPPQNNNYFPISVTNKTKPFIVGNSIYFNRIIDLNPSNELYNSNTLMKFDFIKQELTEVDNTNYPSIYFDKCWVSIDLEINYSLNKNGELIYTYPIDDNLYVYSIKKETFFNKVLSKSKYKISDVRPVNCENVWDNKTYYKHWYQNTLYQDIVYDEYKKIYYRFVNHPTKEYNLNKQFNSLNTKFSIMVLNADFETIFESEILNQTPKYISFDYFVTNKGLWISTNNPENIDYDEDKLQFELFELKKYSNESSK